MKKDIKSEGCASEDDCDIIELAVNDLRSLNEVFEDIVALCKEIEEATQREVESGRLVLH